MAAKNLMSRTSVRKYKSKPKEQQTLAKQRIRELFMQAERTPEFANDYAALARRIAMKYKVRLTSEQKRKICKHCYAYLKQGVNCRVRLQSGKIVYYCMECRRFARIPIKKPLSSGIIFTHLSLI